MKRVLLYLGLWLALGVLNATWLRMHMVLYYPNFGWELALRWALPDAVLWAVLSLIPIRLAARYPVRGKRNIALHLVAGSLVAALVSTLDGSIGYLQGGYTSVGQGIDMRLRESFASNLLVYAIVVAVCHYLRHLRRLRSEERRGAQLHAQLSEARLRALHMQLRPHFLMNALHTVSGLVDVDPGGAKRVIRKLGDVLRTSLSTDQRSEVALREEIDFIRAYLDIEQTRFRDRLRVDIAIPESCLSCTVPAFLLQPLVENALRHGIAPKPDGGRVHIAGRCDADRLYLEVRDDGVGMREPAPAGVRTGIGVANTRARLKTLYGNEADLVLENVDDGGVCARVVLPARRVRESRERTALLQEGGAS